MFEYENMWFRASSILLPDTLNLKQTHQTIDCYTDLNTQLSHKKFYS